MTFQKAFKKAAAACEIHPYVSGMSDKLASLFPDAEDALIEHDCGRDLVHIAFKPSAHSTFIVVVPCDERRQETRDPKYEAPVRVSLYTGSLDVRDVMDDQYRGGWPCDPRHFRSKKVVVKNLDALVDLVTRDTVTPVVPAYLSFMERWERTIWLSAAVAIVWWFCFWPTSVQ